MTERHDGNTDWMLIQRNGKVSTVPLGEVSHQEVVAWVDLNSWDASHLMDTLSLLGASVDPDGWPVGWQRVPSRASMMGGGDAFWVVLFMPGKEGTSAPIGIVTGAKWVVTIHDGALEPLRELWQDALSGSVEVLHSPFHALYEILETVADQYLDSIDKYQDRFDQLEDDILSGQNRARDVFEMRREIHAMRRVLADQRRVSARLARRVTGKSQDQAFIDVYDAFYHVIDNADGLRGVPHLCE